MASKALLCLLTFEFLTTALSFVVPASVQSVSSFSHHATALRSTYKPSCISMTLSLDASKPGMGTLSLVGAGPGDPELLTLKAVKVLQQAELVVADRLISKEILDLITCELRIANKNPGCAEESQLEIYRWVKEGVEAGKRVVRLKIGDPFIFGRGGEELLEAREWGVECEVIPGISSVFSAPLLGGIPVTHRGVANQVFLGTGYAGNYGIADISDYHPQQTAVFLMAVGRLQMLCDDLRRHGYPGDTPVGIVERASTPAQRVVIGTIDTIVDIAAEVQVKAPATIVVGEVVRVVHGDAKGLIEDRLQSLVNEAPRKFMRNMGVLELQEREVERKRIDVRVQ